MTDAATRGRRNRAEGNRWMNRIARDLSYHTGLEVKRELLEVREGKLQDVEIHPELPVMIEAKSRGEISIWTTLKEIANRAEELDLVATAVLKRRNGRGVPSERVVAHYAKGWARLVRPLVENGQMRPVVEVVKTARVYPRVWSGLQEAQEQAQLPYHPVTSLPIARGNRLEGQDVVLLGYEDWLWMMQTGVTTGAWLTD